MGNCSGHTTSCDVEYTFAVIFITISSLIVIGYLSSTIRSFYCKSKKRPLLYLQITVIVSFILGIGCILCDYIHIIEAWIIPKPLRDDYFVPLRVLANIFGFNSYIATDLVIFGRLYFTVYDSVYKLSIYTIIIIILILLTVIACDILYIIDLAATVSINRENLLVCLSSIELTLSASISLMFMKKLHQILSTSDDDQQQLIGDQKDRNQSIDIQFNRFQQKLLNITTKNAIITGIAAVYFAVRFAYREFVAVNYDNNEPIWMVSYVSRSYIFVTNGIAVYFGFAFSTTLYYKLFGKCHICVFKCCARIARKEITKDAINFMSMQQCLADNRDEQMLNLYDNSDTKANDYNATT
eukprot:349324_1